MRVINETAGNGDGRWNGGDSDVNGTTSSSNVDSTRVEAALLATDSQQTRSHLITQNNDLPVSFWPPIQPADRPYRPARHQRRRRKLKIEHIKVSQARNGKTTHLQCTHATWAPKIPSQHSNRVIGPIQQHGRPTIKQINVSQTWNGEMTHLWCTHAAQPPRTTSQHSYRVVGPKR